MVWDIRTSVSSFGDRCNRSGTGLSHGEPLLVEQGAVEASDFHSPVAIGHGLPAVGTITLRRISSNRKLHGLTQRVSVIPAMHDRGITRRFDARVEDDRSWPHRTADRIAAPRAAPR